MIDHELMRIHLSAAVPLRMAELAHVDQQPLATMFGDGDV